MVSKKLSSIYLKNVWIDFLLSGGLSILLFPIFFALQSDLFVTLVSQLLVNLLVWIGNAPHFAATHVRLYGYRNNMRAFPLTSFLVPVVIILAIIFSLRETREIAPYFIKLYLLWSPYHYSGQTVGLTLIYSARAGVPIQGLVRRALSGFVFLTFVTSILRAESGQADLFFFGIRYPSLGIPLGFAKLSEAIMYLCETLFIVLLAREAKERKKTFPWICLIPPLAQFVWFIPGASYQYFFNLVPFFHGIQYLLIAWRMRGAEKPETRGARWFSVRSSLGWYLATVMGGVMLFWGVPRFILAVSDVPILVATPVALAGIQIHHFFVDGVIWKLRDIRERLVSLGAET